MNTHKMLIIFLGVVVLLLLGDIFINASVSAQPLSAPAAMFKDQDNTGAIPAAVVVIDLSPILDNNLALLSEGCEVYGLVGISGSLGGMASGGGGGPTGGGGSDIQVAQYN